MAEKLQHTLERHDTPADWNQVFARIEQIGLPEDLHERATDMARHMTKGSDIEMFGKALHDVLVPDVESMPVDHAKKLYSLITGEDTRTFAEPEERAAIYERAAENIKLLAQMRRSPDDDDAFLGRVANVVALTFGQAHAYDNGNGRLARVSAELIRNGTRDREDLVLLGTSRERTKEESGRQIPSFMQRYESVRDGDTDADVIEAAASRNIPLNDRKAYEKRVDQIFVTTSGY